MAADAGDLPCVGDPAVELLLLGHTATLAAVGGCRPRQGATTRAPRTDLQRRLTRQNLWRSAQDVHERVHVKGVDDGES